MLFGSDNWAGAAPEILDAIGAANAMPQPAYGADPWTEKARASFSEVFEKDVDVFFVATGGAANGLALSTLVPPYGSILCHEASHVHMDECAAPEFFTGGAKLVLVPGADGKITPTALSDTLKQYPDRVPHSSPFSAITITQCTELGTVYRPSEIAAVCDFAATHSLPVHMDGARFANAVASLKGEEGATPADLTWRAGIDVLSLGGTKNGCLAAEAVVFFNPDTVGDFAFRQKRAGQLFSKTRFLSAQFVAYFQDGLWLQLAERANAQARKLARGLEAMPTCRLWAPTEANEVFASFHPDTEKNLLDAGATFYPWVTPGDPAAGQMRRLICSFETTDDEIDAFLSVANKAI